MSVRDMREKTRREQMRKKIKHPSVTQKVKGLNEAKKFARRICYEYEMLNDHRCLFD